MLEDKQSNVNKNFEYIFFSLLGKSIPRDKTDEWEFGYQLPFI